MLMGRSDSRRTELDDLGIDLLAGVAARCPPNS
jgi:hypothetical protein